MFTGDDSLEGVETENGFIAQKDDEVVVRARDNVPFAVRVAAETDHLVSQNGQNRIPVSQLKHRLDGGFTPLSVSSTQFYLSNDPDDVQVPLDFLMEVTWLDTADTHEVVLVFTASKM